MEELNFFDQHSFSDQLIFQILNLGQWINTYVILVYLGITLLHYIYKCYEYGKYFKLFVWFQLCQIGYICIQSNAYSAPAPTWGTVGAAHKKCFEGPQPIQRVGAPIGAIGAGFEAIKIKLL